MYGAPPMYSAPPPPPPPAKTVKPMIAGIMNLITAMGAFYWTYSFFVAGAILAGIPGAAGIATVFGAMCAIGGILALLAAIFCFQRKNYGIALIGSILGMIIGGVFIFGLIATILVAISKSEFS